MDFVSGAASGIGAATARLLAKEGAAVVLGDLNTELAGSVSDEIRQKGGEGRVVKLDVASEQNWVAAMAETKEAYGRLNIAVNGAGVQIPRSNPAETSLSDWRTLMSVNLDGVFLGTKHPIQHPRAGFGSIPNRLLFHGPSAASMSGSTAFIPASSGRRFSRGR